MKLSDIRFGPLAGLALLLVGIVIGALLPLPQIGREANLQQAEQRAQKVYLAEAATNAEERIWKLYRERESLAEQLRAAEESASASGAAGGNTSASDTYTDGIYVIDRDIEPGTYAGRLAPGNDYGYWARLKATDGTVNSIIENAIVSGPFVLTLRQTDRAVELRGVTLAPQE